MLNKLMQIPPFSLNKTEKREALTLRLLELTNSHRANCGEYAAMLRAAGFNAAKCKDYYDIPFLPVSLFKELSLKSIKDEDIFKILTSSGTSGQAVSKIYLDKPTANNQQKTLTRIVSSFTGAARMPMLIIDCPSVIKNRDLFTARGAGVLGFSIFGTDRVYALNDDMEIDTPAILCFLEKHEGKQILLFGFTFMVWLLYKELLKLNREFVLDKAVLIHGGGWKKLLSEAVSKDEFKRRLTDICGIKRIHDYYGMAEQTGCVYMECEYSHLHASVFSDIITRRHLDFSPCDFGETGIIQVLSLLPESYPGHSLLTEDQGVILGEDDCPCGRKGKYFHVQGRLKTAELRGCSDVYANIG